MNWAERRKLLYLLVTFFVIGVVAALLINHYTSVPPTCFDGKRNGGESGADCGGSCTFYCVNELADPKVRWVRSFLVAPGVVHAIAYIEHSNPAAAAKKVPYEFKLYDEKNNILTSRAGTTYIGPFGRTAIVETLIPTGNIIPTTTRFGFTANVPWEKIPQGFAQVVIKTDKQLLEPFTGGTRLTVTLENQSRYAFANMDVVAILYDKEDNAIAISKSLVKVMPAQGSETVYFTWPAQYKERTFRVEVLPRFNPFESQAL